MNKNTSPAAGAVAAAAAIASLTPAGMFGAVGIAIGGIVAALNKSQDDLKEAENGVVA